MERQFDLVVVGTGVASKPASRCREAGWTVAIVDSRPFGGTCALRGCIPKKIFVAAAEAVHAVRALADKGVRADGVAVDWPARMRVKRGVTDPIPRSTEDGYASAGIAAFHGRARFVGPTTLAVGDDRLTGRRVLIATGAMPQPLAFPGAEHVATSDRFLDLEALPPRVVFIGGGFVSFEFAHVAARAGARATIVHRGPRPLESFDPDLVDQLVKRSRELGIGVELNAEVRAVERRAEAFVVSAGAAGRERRFEADLVVHGAGRVPEIHDLDLPAADVKADQRGVVVNEYLQSVSNPAVYAAGDSAASGPPLTPVADHHAEVVATNLLEGNRRKVNYAGLASVVFTVPPLASAGLSEKAAREQGLRFRAHREDTSGWLNTQRAGETTSGSKVLVEEDTGRILGAHLFGPHADEVINVFALAIRLDARAADLKQILYAYPTVASDIPYMVGSDPHS
jgi:glutathione reductase (NADPH)